MYFFFFKQKTAYEMRISDWSSDVCSSDLMLLDRTFSDPHMLGDTALREVLELFQLERLAAFRGQRLQYFVQTRQFFLPAQASMDVHLFIDDVQRIQIRHQVDRDDP